MADAPVTTLQRTLALEASLRRVLLDVFAVAEDHQFHCTICNGKGPSRRDVKHQGQLVDGRLVMVKDTDIIRCPVPDAIRVAWPEGI